MRHLRLLLKLIAVTVAIGAWAIVLRPTNLGGSTTYLLVRGSSMLPTYADGDLLVLGAAPGYGIGDAVAYRVPEGEIGAGHLVLHRIIGGSATGGFTLQGDNNDDIDPWQPRGTDVVGTVRLAIPGLGTVLKALRQPVMLASLAAALVAAWIVTMRPGRDVAAIPRLATGVRFHRVLQPAPRIGTRYRPGRGRRPERGVRLSPSMSWRPA